MEKKMVYIPPAVKTIPVVLEEDIVSNTAAMKIAGITVNNSSDLEEEKSPFIVENLEEDTGFLMLQVSNLWKEHYGKTLRKRHALSSMQYAALASVYRFSLHGTKQVTHAMLVKYLKIDSMTLSDIFRGLETKGYIHRVTHPTDVKANIVTLTSKGKELVSQAVDIITEADYKFFNSLNGNTDYFIKQLKKLLEANE